MAVGIFCGLQLSMAVGMATGSYSKWNRTKYSCDARFEEDISKVCARGRLCNLTVSGSPRFET